MNLSNINKYLYSKLIALLNIIEIEIVTTINIILKNKALRILEISNKALKAALLILALSLI